MKIQKNWFVVSIVILLAGLLISSASAQEQSVYLKLEWADVAAFPQVRLHLSAWDADSLPLTGLAANNFLISEDGGTEFNPDSLAEDSDAPLWIVLVIDVSKSMEGQPLADAKAAAVRFVDRMSAQDQVAVIAFSDQLDTDPIYFEPGLEIGFTEDLDQVYDLIDGLEAAGGTHLYNAVEKAVAQFINVPVGHRAVLVLSDGRNDPIDVGDPDSALSLAQENNVPVFVIGLGNEIDEPYLQRLASETGGLFRLAPRSSDLAHLFDDMASLLKTTYTLTYTSTLPTDGTLHAVSVRLQTTEGAASDGIDFGPLPLVSVQPTEEPTEEPSPTEEPTAIPPTNTPIPIPTSTPAPPPPPETNYTGWLLAAVAALLISLLLFLFRPKRKPIMMVCANCGFEVGEAPTGVCPECGGERFLPAKSSKNKG